MSEYLPVQIKRFAGSGVKTSDSSEQRYWERFKSPILVKEYASITHVEFCPSKPFDFAVTSSTRVQVYSSSSQTVKKTLSRFKDVAHCGSFRKDGKMIVAGDATGSVQIFDLGSRAILRNFAGHKDAVRVTAFSPHLTQVVSASDDKTVRVWDLPNESALHIFDDHQDHVRSAAICPENPHIILSGSYDHTVRLWDTRSSTPCVSTMMQGSPVESVLFLPGSSLVATAGSNEVKIWNILTGGKHFQTLNNHSKSVTTMCLDGSGRRLLTGSLDNQVKIYSLETYQVGHSLKYPAPILSMAMSPNDTHIVVGMATGLLSIRQRIVKSKDIATKNRRADAVRGGTYLHFKRGASHRPDAGDLRINEIRKKKLKEYDKLLKSFQYGKALDNVLDTNQMPIVVISLLEELVHRGGLGIALGARDDVGLVAITQFIHRHIVNPKFTSLLSYVTEMILDMYSPVIGQSVLIDELFLKLKSKLRLELTLQEELARTMGVLESIMVSSQRSI